MIRSGARSRAISVAWRTLRASGLLRERRSGRWVYYSLDLDRLALLRVAITDLLTPSDAATTACLCSDCGTGRTAMPQPGPLRRLPILAEISQ
jgi:hypothetical protein